MSVRAFCLLLLTLQTVLLTQCATGKKALKPVEGTENSKDGPIYLVGIVEFVNPEQKFVLFKAQGGISIPPGHALTALDATGALSELVLSPERKGTHLTADIKTGHPRAGNLVIFRPGPPQASPPGGQQTPPPPAPSPTPAGFFPPSPAPGQVEWREGQPPPFDAGQPQLMPAATTNPVPFEPIPLEPTPPAQP